MCGPCQRGSRVCPPRPSLKIIDDGAKYRKALSRSKSEVTKIHEGEIISSNNDSLQTSNNVQAHVSMSASEKLSCRVIAMLQIEDPSFSLRVVGDFICQIPRLLGHCQAIDATALCAITSYEHFLRGSDPSRRINPDLYGRALQSLQRSLNNPKEWNSLGTLCSVILLHRLEVSDKYIAVSGTLQGRYCLNKTSPGVVRKHTEEWYQGSCLWPSCIVAEERASKKRQCNGNTSHHG